MAAAVLAALRGSIIFVWSAIFLRSRSFSISCKNTFAIPVLHFLNSASVLSIFLSISSTSCRVSNIVKLYLKFFVSLLDINQFPFIVRSIWWVNENYLLIHFTWAVFIWTVFIMRILICATYISSIKLGQTVKSSSRLRPPSSPSIFTLFLVCKIIKGLEHFIRLLLIWLDRNMIIISKIY